MGTWDYAHWIRNEKIKNLKKNFAEGSPTVNDRLSPRGLICQNGFWGRGLIREGELNGRGAYKIMQKSSVLKIKTTILTQHIFLKV